MSISSMATFWITVTYNGNGLRFQSFTEVICQESFHLKQETKDKVKQI